MIPDVYGIDWLPEKDAVATGPFVNAKSKYCVTLPVLVSALTLAESPTNPHAVQLLAEVESIVEPVPSN